MSQLQVSSMAASSNRLDGLPYPVAPARPSHEVDRLVHWLLASLKLHTSVFHVGQYCGNWRASTAGHALASYHLVLGGRCFVHIDGAEPIELGPRDGVFFLRDIPHFLSGEASRGPAGVASAAMQAVRRPLREGGEDGAGLACGFFDFQGTLSEFMIGGFPDHIVFRADAEGLSAPRLLFDLMLAEANHPPDAPSPLVARLADVLFFYVLRHLAQSDDAACGLWPLVRRPEFSALVEAILAAPADDWSVAAMARAVHMSRASFFEHFTEISGTSPAQFLLLLRMRIAAQRLHEGETTAAAAEHVGYQSIAAFSRAFSRVMGEKPSAYRRSASQ
ncbi:MAG: AraC family transcriptional regulator [Pseudomonadota bacterium]